MLFNRTSNEVESYRSKLQITVKGNNTPKPIQHFEEGNFPEYIVREIRYVYKKMWKILSNNYRPVKLMVNSLGDLVFLLPHLYSHKAGL